MDEGIATTLCRGPQYTVMESEDLLYTQDVDELGNPPSDQNAKPHTVRSSLTSQRQHQTWAGWEGSRNIYMSMQEKRKKIMMDEHVYIFMQEKKEKPKMEE